MRVSGLVAALAAFACGPPVSLDDPDAPSPPGTSGESFGATSSPAASSGGQGQGTDPDDGSEKLDIGARQDLPPEPLPPGVCPPDCQFELSLSWSSEGPIDPSPLDPEDQLLVAVQRDGSVVLAEERQGSIELARLEPRFGREQWRMPLDLPCDPCRLAGLRLHPGTDALLSGYGADGEGVPVAFVARVQLDGPSLSWSTATPLVPSPGVAPRAGPLVVVDEGTRLALPALEGSMRDGQEHMRLLVHDADSGRLASTEALTVQPGTGDATLPLAAPLDDLRLATSQPVWDGLDLVGDLLRVHVDDGLLDGQRLLAPALAMDSTGDGRTLALSQTPDAGQATLHLHYGDLDEPTRWTATQVQLTDSAPVPALAMSPLGHAYVATRIATGMPGRETDTSIELTRWSEHGEPSWQVTLPLQTDYVERPVSLQLGEDDALVLGAHVDGRRYVEQRAPDCVCD